MKYLSLAASITLALVGSSYAACITTAPETAPATRFFSVNETVSDIFTGLEWTRCSIGQAYEDDRCLGTPTEITTLGEALDVVADANNSRYGGHNDWRLPNIKQLQSIVEYSCHTPAITSNVFPDTPPSPFITNTPNITLDDALFLDFRFGLMVTEAFNTTRMIRLVRDI